MRSASTRTRTAPTNTTVAKMPTGTPIRTCFQAGHVGSLREGNPDPAGVGFIIRKANSVRRLALHNDGPTAWQLLFGQYRRGGTSAVCQMISHPTGLARINYRIGSSAAIIKSDPISLNLGNIRLLDVANVILASRSTSFHAGGE